MEIMLDHSGLDNINLRGKDEDHYTLLDKEKSEKCKGLGNYSSFNG